MDYRILGPLEVGLDGSPFTVKGRKPRALLALLLLHRNEVVPAERLIDDLWGENPPATAGNTLQVYVSQLRKLIDAGLVREGPGYSLRVEPDGLDAERFERLAGEAASALDRRAYAEASKLLDEAFALWRGSPLVDVQLRVVRTGGDHPARGAEAGRARSPDRSRARARPPRPGRRRGRGPRGREPATRAFARAAHARALPFRAPGGRARGVSGSAARSPRRAGPRTWAGAPRARAGHPAPGRGARSEAASGQQRSDAGQHARRS